MKIIKEGQQELINWWVDRDIKCTLCGKIVRLETEDEKLPEFHSESTYVKQLKCTCGTWNKIVDRRNGLQYK